MKDLRISGCFGRGSQGTSTEVWEIDAEGGCQSMESQVGEA